jgi:hypothetical protein
MNHLETENFLRSYLYKAKVLLIGGGSFYLQDHYQDEDDRIWIRVNNHYTEQGGPCHILYTSGTQEPEELEHHFVIECKPLPEKDGNGWDEATQYYLRYDTHTYKETNPFGPEHEWLNNLHRELGTMPLTGMIAVSHLLSMPILELELAGFDFYSMNGISPRVRDSHEIFPQIEWLAEQTLKDKRLIVPETLEPKLGKALINRQLREFKQLTDWADTNVR